MKRFNVVMHTPKIALIFLLSVVFVVSHFSFARADSGNTLSGFISFGTSFVPAPNINLEFNDPATGNDVKTVTDSVGYYSIPNVPNSSYNGYVMISGNHGDGTTYPTYFQPTPHNAPIVVNGSDVTQNINFNTSRLAVTIKDSYSNPIPNASVNVSSVAYESFTDSSGRLPYGAIPGNIKSFASADSSGTFTFALIPGVTYKACATLSDGSQSCAANLTLGGDTAVEIDFAHSNVLSGSVTFGATAVPAANINVEFDDPSDGNSEKTTTDSLGHYTISNVPDGHYNPYVLIFGGGHGDGSQYPTRFQPTPHNTPVVVNGADVTQNINFTTNKLAITVKDENGNAVSGASLNIATTAYESFTDSTGALNYGVVPGSIGSSATTDANGAFTFALVSGVTYRVCAVLPDGSQHCPQDFIFNSDTSIEINPATPVPAAITSANNASVGIRAPFSFLVTTTGNPVPAISYGGSLPTGITFTDNGDGTATLSGAAEAGTNGMYRFNLIAYNGSGDSMLQHFAFTITTASSLPAFTSPTSDSEVSGQVFTTIITTNGYPVPAITKVGNLPTGLTLIDNNDGTATLTATANNTLLGAYNLKFKATNSIGQVTQSFTQTVTKAPVFKGATQKTGKVGTSFSLPVKSSGYNTPTLSENGALPSGLTFADKADGTGVIAGTPSAGSSGTYIITITATNNYGTAQENLTIKINEAPAITSPNVASATVGSPFSFHVTTTGFPAPAVTKTGTLPNGITLQASTNTFSGLPKAESAGTYPLTITAKNSSGTTTQTFTITVH